MANPTPLYIRDTGQVIKKTELNSTETSEANTDIGSSAVASGLVSPGWVQQTINVSPGDLIPVVINWAQGNYCIVNLPTRHLASSSINLSFVNSSSNPSNFMLVFTQAINFTGFQGTIFSNSTFPSNLEFSGYYPVNSTGSPFPVYIAGGSSLILPIFFDGVNYHIQDLIGNTIYPYGVGVFGGFGLGTGLVPDPIVDGKILTSHGWDVETGTGTVTSVGLSLPSIFNVTNSPIISNGTIVASFVDQNAGLFFAGPSSGGGATPGFRTISVSDIPSLPAYVPYTGANQSVNLGSESLSSGPITVKNIGSDTATLGPELTTNGSFNGNATGWTLGSDWAYNTNDVILTVASSGMGTLSQTIAVTSGVSYRVEWTQQQSVQNNCSITPQIGSANGIAICYASTSAQTIYQVITATATGNLVLTFTPTFITGGTGTITISNISVMALTPIGVAETLEDSNSNATIQITGSRSYNNMAVGYLALQNNTLGTYNVAVGAGSLFSNLTGSSNSAFGYASLYANTTGVNNSAFGQYSLYANTTGVNNSAFGQYSLYANTTGASNSAFGQYSLYANTSGASNSAFGQYSLYANTTGVNNTSSGYETLYRNIVGSDNSAFGYGTLYNNTSSGNSAFGYKSLFYSTGGNNTAFGYDTGPNITTASQCIVIGYNSDVPSETNNGQMSIGNIIYGFGNTGTGQTVSTGRIAIGQNTDDGLSKLQVNGLTKALGFASPTNAIGTVTTTATARFDLSAVNTVSLSGAACTFTFTAPLVVNVECILEVTQATVGTLSLPSTVNAGSFGSIPQPSTVTNSVTVYKFWYDGTTYWLLACTSKPVLATYTDILTPSLFAAGLL